MISKRMRDMDRRQKLRVQELEKRLGNVAKREKPQLSAYAEVSWKSLMWLAHSPSATAS